MGAAYTRARLIKRPDLRRRIYTFVLRPARAYTPTLSLSPSISLFLSVSDDRLGIPVDEAAIDLR